LNLCNAYPELTLIKIVKVEYLSDYQLRLRFSDGAHGDYDFSRMLANDTVLTRPLKTSAGKLVASHEAV
jgi:hypothetical protein